MPCCLGDDIYCAGNSIGAEESGARAAHNFYALDCARWYAFPENTKTPNQVAYRITVITAGASLAVRLDAVAIVVSRLIRSSRLKEIKRSSFSSVLASEVGECVMAKHRLSIAEFKRSFFIYMP